MADLAYVKGIPQISGGATSAGGQALDQGFNALALRSLQPRSLQRVKCHGQQILAQHDFPDNTGITEYVGGSWYAGGTYSTDSTNYKAGEASVNFLSSGADHQPYYASQWSAVDGSGGWDAEIRFYIPSNLTSTQTVRIGLLSNNTINNYCYYTLFDDPIYRTAGWHKVRISSNQNPLSVAGGWDASAITGWAMRLINFNYGESIVIDQIKVLTHGTAKPIVLFRTDDGNASAMVMAAALEKYGYFLHFCIVGSTIGGSGKLTWDQCRDLVARGHFCLNHGYAHLDESTATVEEFLEDYYLNLEKMYEERVGACATVLMTPTNWISASGDEQELITQHLQHCDFIWTTREKFPESMKSGNIDTMVSGGNPYDLRTHGNDVDSDDGQDATFITSKVVGHPGFHTILHHNIYASDPPGGYLSYADYRAMVAQVAASEANGDLEVQTIFQYTNG